MNYDDLKEFQQKAIEGLKDRMEKEGKYIVFRSPTGSGKTIMLSFFMRQYMEHNKNVVFVWLSPGKGNLAEQSRKKMKKIFKDYKDHIKDLRDIEQGGFQAGDCCFINWEKLNRGEKNKAMREDGEYENLIRRTTVALEEGLTFNIIIDESHQNTATKNSKEVIKRFEPHKVILSSATQQNLKKDATEPVEVEDEDVKEEGLIKKMIVINRQPDEGDEATDNRDEEDSEIKDLLEKALAKRGELLQLFTEIGKEVNPLIVVQLPNKSEKSRIESKMLDKVVDIFGKKGISYEDDEKTLAVWLSEPDEGKGAKGAKNFRKNLEGLEENNAEQVAVIIKQAVATGWDCPRAHILVKFRENMKRDFTIQTIGRIRRMPEGKHYYERGDYEGKYAPLNRCYIYTFDEKFVRAFRKDMQDKEIFTHEKLVLKGEYARLNEENFPVKKQKWKEGTDLRDPQKALEAIVKYFREKLKFSLGENNKKFINRNDEDSTKTKLKNVDGFKGFEGFDENSKVIEKVKYYIPLGVASNTEQISEIPKVLEWRPLATDGADWTLRNHISLIGMEIGMHYADMRTILFLLFCEEDGYKDRLLSLSTREMYFFIINNTDTLRRAFSKAIAWEVTPELHGQETKLPEDAEEKQFVIPNSTEFTYKKDGGGEKSQKNVYEGYFYAAEPRSASEREFERFCEGCDKVDWIYKNGDKGDQYFSIVYKDNWRQHLFYPDYILSIKGTIWIIEAKGGFSESDQSENIDDLAEKKFNALKAYLDRHSKHRGPKLRGGFVRIDKGESNKLLIATKEYTEGKDEKAWKPLKDFIESL